MNSPEEMENRATTPWYNEEHLRNHIKMKVNEKSAKSIHLNNNHDMYKSIPTSWEALTHFDNGNQAYELSRSVNTQDVSYIQNMNDHSFTQSLVPEFIMDNNEIGIIHETDEEKMDDSGILNPESCDDEIKRLSSAGLVEREYISESEVLSDEDNLPIQVNQTNSRDIEPEVSEYNFETKECKVLKNSNKIPVIPFDGSMDLHSPLRIDRKRNRPLKRAFISKHASPIFCNLNYFPVTSPTTRSNEKLENELIIIPCSPIVSPEGIHNELGSHEIIFESSQLKPESSQRYLCKPSRLPPSMELLLNTLRSHNIPEVISKSVHYSDDADITGIPFVFDNKKILFRKESDTKLIEYHDKANVILGPDQ